MKKILFISLAVVLALSVGLVGCGGDGGGTTGSTKIVIGMSRSLTGGFAVIHSSAFGAIYPTYITMTNTAGGITVNGTAFDVEAKVLNDNSEAGKLQTHINALTNDVEDGEVHTIFGPTCTYFIDLAAPICNDAGVVLMTAEGGATFLEGPGYLPEWPYVFITLSFSDWHQLPVLAPLLATNGYDDGDGDAADTAYIFWQNDAHGLEYLATAATEFPAAGITIVGNASVLATDPGFNPPALLAAANATNPDVVCVFAYPGEIMGLTGNAIALGYNFDAWCTGPAANFGWFGIGGGGFGPAAEGVICFAVANNKTSPAMANLFNNVLAGGVAEGQDFWGHPLYWAAMEIWQNAVEEVGALADDGKFIIDQDDLRAELARYTTPENGVTTVLGPTYYTMFGTGGGILAYQCHPGEIGQWQSGYVEVIGGSNVTSSLVYPKANWPVGP